MLEYYQAMQFSGWLQASMQRRGLSQAQLARTLGVADAQVSRWRRGQVVPTVQSLQRIADALGVARGTLDVLAGYPVEPVPAAADAELDARAAELRELLRSQVPRDIWQAYVNGCEALAVALSRSHAASSGESASHLPHSIGFRTQDDSALGHGTESPPEMRNQD
ncbi:MAG: helix-turn-helix domain-containing protein [Chloroflexota bacterium]